MITAYQRKYVINKHFKKRSPKCVFLLIVTKIYTELSILPVKNIFVITFSDISYSIC